MNLIRFSRITAMGTAIAVASLLLPLAVDAGTLCGTVRDASTAQAVARAGVFLRATDGTYTGLYGATDEAGFFCIDSVPAGVYDIEVRVDDYLVTYERDVEVTDVETTVEIETATHRFFFAPPYPNPGKDQVTFRFTFGEPGSLRLVIFDYRGREVKGWSGRRESSGDGHVQWDLRDRDGRPVAPGTYFARLVAGDFIATRKIVLVH